MESALVNIKIENPDLSLEHDTESQMKTDERFNNLVENAIDFLNKAIVDIDTEPKYAIIHFYSAVELFLKARLFKEHWTLVVAKNQDLDWEKFKAGNFQSISLVDAANRLDKVVGSGLNELEIKAFKEVGEHRNKLMHFYHQTQSASKDERLVKDVITQLHRAWHYLHILLLIRWEDVFKKWETKLFEFDAKLMKYHDYLEAIFNTVKSNIEKQKLDGFWFTECPSCHFEAISHINKERIVYNASCMVCGLSNRYINVHCPKCNNLTAISEGEEEVKCSFCKHELNSSEIYEALETSGETAHCSECSGYHSVAGVDDGKWVCLDCHYFFDEMDQCEWCGDLNTGDMNHSYLSGCNVCEGLSGWQSDKDD